MDSKAIRINWRRRSFIVFTAMCVIISFSQFGFLKFHGFCVFQRFLGIPCPACGFTRSVFALFLSDIGTSFDFSPVTLPLLALFLSYAVYLIVAISTKVIDRFEWRTEVRFVEGIDMSIFVLLTINWIYQIANSL